METEHQEISYEQHKSCIPGRIRQTLVSLREKTNARVLAIKDHRCFQSCWSPDRIESPRIYHVWPGNNVFFFKGRLICGPDPKGLLLTLVSLTLSSYTFIVNVANGPSVTVIFSVFLTIVVLFNLGLVSTIDPGIIPRDEGICINDLEENNRKNQNAIAIINGLEVKLKYCSICNIYRPPRSCHCAVCDNCVEKFDHHCPWIGHCIGLRNYRFYVTFLVTSLSFFIYILVFSSKRIQQTLSSNGSLLRDCPETLALVFFSSVSVCFLGCLACYHLHLIAINQTAYENFHHKFKGSRNPYNKGIMNNFKEVFLTSQPPSKINLQADAIFLDDDDIEMQESTSTASTSSQF